MRRRLFGILSAISMMGLILCILPALLSFVPQFWEGIQFIGWYKSSATATPATPTSSKYEYDIHREYRGLFFDWGCFAVGSMVEDWHRELDREYRPDEQGFQYRVSNAAVPLYPLDGSSRSFPPFFESGTLRYGNPSPPNSLFTDRVRFNIFWPILITAVCPTWWLVAKVRRRFSRPRQAEA